MKEKHVLKAVLDLLAAERIFAIRLNTGAGWANGRLVRHHSAGKGVADILAFPRQRVLWIETKSSTGKQRLEQMWFERDVADLGHVYLLARSSDDVLAWLRKNS